MKPFTLLAAMLLSSPALAQTMSASRLYKLCEIEDPSCGPLMQQIFKASVASLKAQGKCGRYVEVPVEYYAQAYMTVLGENPMWDRMTAVDFMASTAMLVGACRR